MESTISIPIFAVLPENLVSGLPRRPARSRPRTTPGPYQGVGCENLRFAPQSRNELDDKTRRNAAASSPERAHGPRGPPLGPSAGISPRRPYGRSRPRSRPGLAGMASNLEEWRPGSPEGAPRRPSGERFARRPRGGCSVRMHFSRVSRLRGLGSTAFSRAFRNIRRRMPSGGPGPPPGARAGTGRQNSRKTRHIGHAGARKAAKTRGPRKPGFSRHGKTRRIGAPGTPNHRKNTWFPDFRRANLAEMPVKPRIKPHLRKLF